MPLPDAAERHLCAAGPQADSSGRRIEGEVSTATGETENCCEASACPEWQGARWACGCRQQRRKSAGREPDEQKSQPLVRSYRDRCGNRSWGHLLRDALQSARGAGGSARGHAPGSGRPGAQVRPSSARRIQGSTEKSGTAERAADRNRAWEQRERTAGGAACVAGRARQRLGAAPEPDPDCRLAALRLPKQGQPGMAPGQARHDHRHVTGTGEAPLAMGPGRLDLAPSSERRDSGSPPASEGGGGWGTRTPDLLRARQALSQLS